MSNAFPFMPWKLPPKSGPAPQSKSKHSVMKLKTTLMLGAVTLALGFSTAANAAFINGTINFSSGAGTGLLLRDAGGGNTTNLAAAVGVNNWGTPQVDLTSGNFTVIPSGTAATFTAPWIFDPSTATSPLWSVTFGGTTFTFNLTSSTIQVRNSVALYVTGTGTVTGTGFQATPGTWSFSPSNRPDGQGRFSWAGSTGTGVPDGGTTVALLGGALLGLAGLRRKFNSR